jgi:hypothetical protein
VLVEDKDGVWIRCDKCGSRLIIAANALQASVRRMPSGWLRFEEGDSHTCPLCSRAAIDSLRANTR